MRPNAPVFMIKNYRHPCKDGGQPHIAARLIKMRMNNVYFIGFQDAGNLPEKKRIKSSYPDGEENTLIPCFFISSKNSPFSSKIKRYGSNLVLSSPSNIFLTRFSAPPICILVMACNTLILRSIRKITSS